MILHLDICIILIETGGSNVSDQGIVLLEDGTSQPYEFTELETAQEFVRHAAFDLKVWIEGYDMFDRDDFLKLRSMPQDEAIPF